jgi:hypothetical protein
VLVGDLSTGLAAGRVTGVQVRQASVPLAVQAQAGLTRASVLQVTGRLDEARLGCQSLLRADRFAALNTVLEIPARACLAELRSLQGEPQQAAIELAALARRSPGDRWLALVRAELAERLGDASAAEALYRVALAGHDVSAISGNAGIAGNAGTTSITSNTTNASSSGAAGSSGDTIAGADVYSVAAFADWLLSQGRHAEALVTLDRADPEADALLLRRAIALHRVGDAASEAAARQIGTRLDARFDAARLRGENFHQREQARLALDVYGRADQALPLALDNWSRQKEPADALLLMRAAVAAGKPGAADPVQRLIAQGYGDARLLRAQQAAGSDVARNAARPIHTAPAAVALQRVNPDPQRTGGRP